MDAEKPKQTWGNHRSGGCPELVGEAAAEKKARETNAKRMARRQHLIAEQERDLAEYIKHCPSKAALWPCPLEAFAEKLMKQQPPTDDFATPVA